MKKNFIIFLTIFMIFNGTIRIDLFKGYREYTMTTIDSLENESVS